MGQDKAGLTYHDEAEWKRAYDLLSRHTDRAYLSVNQTQAIDDTYSGVEQIIDIWENIGPMNGIASAMQTHPKAAWLVVACDMPSLNDDTVRHLIAKRDAIRDATVYVSGPGSLEPLCAIYEPSIEPAITESILKGSYSLYRCLESRTIERVSPVNPNTLVNINTPEESDNYRRHGVDYSSGNEDV